MSRLFLPGVAMRCCLLSLLLLFSSACLACDVPGDFPSVVGRLTGHGAASSADAVAVIEPLAECGYAPAQYWLGFAYYKVYGKPLDYELAFAWNMRAAVQGYVPAQMDAASAYRLGAGVPKSWRSAVYWYRRVAVHGGDAVAVPALDMNPVRARARHAIAGLLPASYAVAAYTWASLALSDGWSIAAETIMNLEKVMSPEEIDFAMKCAVSCSEHNDCSCDGLEGLGAP